MELGLKDRKVLITGAGRGIGRAVALEFAKEGARVALVSRTESDLKNLLKRLGGKKGDHTYAVADLTKKDSPQKVFKKIEKEFGNVDILINNVGDSLSIKDPLCPLSDWHKVLRINLEIAIELSNLVIPKMLKNKWGRIVNVASTASMENNGPVTYCTAKAALLAYTRCMGRVYAKDGIVISALIPGAVVDEKSYWDQALKERPDHAKKYLDERCPAGRFASPDEVSAVVALLCSERATFCQGSIVPVDGGQSRHFFNTSY